jgi:predicted RND superfamily exporter protein
VSLLGLPNVGIEYDMSKIQSSNSPAWDLDEEVADMVDLSLIPAVVLADSPEHAQKIAAEARRRMETLPAGEAVTNVLTLRDLVPDQQDEKLEILSDLRTRIERLPKKAREGELSESYQQLVRTVGAGKVTVEDLPIELRAPFQMKAGEVGATVLFFPSRNLTDAAIMYDLAEIVYDLPASSEGGTLERGVNDALILLDIIALVERDAVKMLLITLFGLLFTAFVAFRRPRRMLILIGTITAAIVAALGVVGLLGVKFNFINLMVLPIWLGLGVDATFHLMVRCEESPQDLAGFVATTLAVSAAFITSMIGFGSMFVTEHTGLYTMGIAAVAGLGTIAVVSMLIQGANFMRLPPVDD